MKTIFSIFRNDLESIIRYFFVILIILAISILPALYAWVNIYANTDPYVNTGKIPVAVASRDRGIEAEDGSRIDSAEEVMEELEESTDIGWKVLDDPEKALQGVSSGKYYAAVIFEDGFTYEMHHFQEAVEDPTPSVTYYSNTKKNAVAAKITDTAVENLMKKINAEYLEATLGRLFESTGSLAGDLDSDDAVDRMIEQLVGTRDALHLYNEAIAGFLNTGELSESVSGMENRLDSSIEKGRAGIDQARQAYHRSQNVLSSLSSGIRNRADQLETTLQELEDVCEAMQQPVDEATRAKLEQKAEDLSDEILVQLQDLRALIQGDGGTAGARMAAAALDLMIGSIENVREDVNSPSKLDEALTEIDTLKTLTRDDLQPAMERLLSEVDNALKVTSPLLSSGSRVLDDIDPLLESTGNTLTGLKAMMARLQKTLIPLENRLDQIIERVQSADKEEQRQILSEFLNGDPDSYSGFFSNLVDVKTTEIYSVGRYGSAMAPFYSVLAIWVGGVMLVSILKTRVNRRKFPEASEAQCFFGRYLIFALVGQFQAAVIVLGDIFLLHCTPVHPWLMWGAAAVTSLVFVMLIYALTLSFGNIGQAIVIVVMVLQIAGSSGSFPIEILPPVFAKIYLFFPFPYAINAMREALCGMYGLDYLIYLAQLLVFFGLGILLGLLIRKPFIGMNEFVTERLEKTEVL